MGNINYEKIRENLIEYYGTSMFAGFSVAIINASDIEKMSEDELVNAAKKVGFKINKYRE